MKLSVVNVYSGSSLVGSLPIDQYRAIQREVFRDWRPYALQALNVLKVVLLAIGQLAMVIPILWFWLIVIAAAVDSAAMDVARISANSSLSSLIGAFSGTFELAVIGALIGFGARTAFTGRIAGASNSFEDQISARIRDIVNVPDSSSVVVVEEFSSSDR